MISGLYSPGAGLSNVMCSLIQYLGSSFSIVCIGFDPDKKDDETTHSQLSGHDLYTYPVGGTANLFKISREDLRSYFDRYKPVCILTLGPVMFNRYLLVQLQQFRTEVKVISYLSVEGELVDVNFLKYINLVDACVFYTEAVHNSFKKLLRENTHPGSGLEAVRSSFIGHGVDKRNFYPLASDNDKNRRSRSRKMIYADRGVNEDSFVVLNMNRPSHRKRIEVTIEGFRLFAADKENVYLHLHMGPTDSNVKERYRGFARKAGIKDQVIITPDIADMQVKPEDWLNNLYNACNVGISTSRGEGWGLGLFEHAATKAAIVAPGHTGFAENWEHAAILMPWTEKQFVFYEYAHMFTVSPEEVCKSLNMLYFDKNLADKVALDCYHRTQDPKYDWENVANRFREIILSM